MDLSRASSRLQLLLALPLLVVWVAVLFLGSESWMRWLASFGLILTVAQILFLLRASARERSSE